jgi:glycosyltransferase involved in cell wall biosynthesis
VAGLERAAVATLGAASVALSQAVIVLNPTVRELIERRAGPRPVVWVPNGVDLDRYRPPAPEERRELRERLGWDERPRALFVGRLVEKKGVDLALRAAAASEAELVVVGPGRPPDRAPEGVTFKGAQPREAVAELYRAADVFVLPSRGEGFPVTAQEALASGLPVVLLDDPAYAPYADGANDAMRLVAPTPDAVATAIRSLTESAEARSRASAQAASHARARFSWARAADEHEHLYARLRG